MSSSCAGPSFRSRSPLPPEGGTPNEDAPGTPISGLATKRDPSLFFSRRGAGARGDNPKNHPTPPSRAAWFSGKGLAFHPLLRAPAPPREKQKPQARYSRAKSGGGELPNSDNSRGRRLAWRSQRSGATLRRPQPAAVAKFFRLDVLARPLPKGVKVQAVPKITRACPARTHSIQIWLQRA